MIYCNVTCLTASVDKTNTAKTHSASHISHDWPILSYVVRGCITWWKLKDFSEKAAVSFSSSLRRWRHQKPPKASGVAFHKNRRYTRTVLYQRNLPILSDGSVPLEWQLDMLQSSTRAVSSAVAHDSWRYCYIADASSFLKGLRGGSTKIALVAKNIWKPSIIFFFKFFTR